MRIVTSPSFCSVCLEGLWLSLLKRVSLIDDIAVLLPDSPHDTIYLDIHLVPLGQFRSGGVVEGEVYSIYWSKDGQPLPQHTNKTSIATNSDVYGLWEVSVHLDTPQVRKDPYSLLKSSASIDVLAGDVTPNVKINFV